MKNRKIQKVKITEGIAYSKTRSEWICSWCEEEIPKGEETVLIQGLEKSSTSNNIYLKQGGARIHLDCVPKMCKAIKTIKDDKEKYAILNTLNIKDSK